MPLVVPLRLSANYSAQELASYALKILWTAQVFPSRSPSGAITAVVVTK